MSNTIKHRSGPWKVVRQDDIQDEAYLAEARLRAAAPELLEALIMVRDADDDCIRDVLPKMPSFARARIDSAISKAEGGKK